jgi:hypothetical protein
MKKLIIVTIIVFSFVVAQNQFKYHLGLSASGIGGSGLTYRHYMGDDNIRFAGFIYAEDGDVTNELGFAFEKSFIITKYTRLYGVVGLEHQYIKDSYEDWDYQTDTSSHGVSRYSLMGVGIGFGVEATFFDHISVYIEAGERFYSTNGSRRYWDDEDEDTTGISPVATIGIGYSF